MSVFLARPEHVGAGIPLAVENLFDTAGLRTTYGSILFADHVPERTAVAVARGARGGRRLARSPGAAGAGARVAAAELLPRRRAIALPLAAPLGEDARVPAAGALLEIA